MNIPQYVNDALITLEKAGFEAYLVGGCVRDSLLGISPNDWDVCTVATPEQIQAVFAHNVVIPTGIQHGTVTVICNDIPLEITTYRTESEYHDHRHPETVTFVKTIEEDLSRRDFTVNAIAYHPSRGIVDPYDGVSDLKSRTLRAVGNPRKRFEEDALRILRAFRFACVYGFDIEECTKTAMLDRADLLQHVAAERIQSELKRLLMGAYVRVAVHELYPILFSVLPELEACRGVDQHSPYHCFDVLVHSISCVGQAQPDLSVRLAALLHDIGKPICFTIDSQGVGHFFGHASISKDLAHDALSRLRFDSKTIEEVCILIQYHDVVIEATRPTVRRWLNKLGVDRFRKLLAVKKADTLAQNPELIPDRIQKIETLQEILNSILEEQACFCIRDLDVNGNDIQSLGIVQGPAVGRCLQWLLEEVMEQRIPNIKQELLDAVRKKLDYFMKNR